MSLKEMLTDDLRSMSENTELDRRQGTCHFIPTAWTIMAKSIDDRIGVAILIEMMKQAPASLEVCAAFTVQEEIGGRGAGVAAHSFKPDIAIVIDATPAYDLPTQDQQENKYFNSVLGRGPAIYIADKYTLYNQSLVGFVKKTAERRGISYQLRQPGGEAQMRRSTKA
jgi:endoglucanase